MDYTDNPRVHVDSNGKMYIDGVEVKVNEVVFENKKAMTAAYRDLKNSFDLGAIGAEEFYSELESLRDYYLADGSAAWWNYTRKILDYEQSLKDAKLQLVEDEINRLGSMYSLGMISAGQYYGNLKALRDQYFSEGSKEWKDYTDAIAKFYGNMLTDAEDSAQKLTERLFGDVLQSVTVKDQSGNVTDRFYRLAPIDETLINKFFEGYSFLQEAGAPSVISDKYLSMSAVEASEFYDLLKGLGDRLPAYFDSVSSTREEVLAASRGVYGADVLAQAVTEILKALENSGFAKDIDINQSFYGASLSPADAAREAVNALKLQGVEI